VINTGIGRVKPAHEAMCINGDCIKDAPLYVWLGPGGDWEYNNITKGVTLCPGDDRAIEALPGDWIIKLPDGSLTIARGVEQQVNWEEKAKDLADYALTLLMMPSRAVWEGGEYISGYWQTEDWLLGLKELAEEVKRS
jgi:hypothetical protein